MADTTLTSTPPEANLRWYQGVPRYAWFVLAICALGWLFDTMDQHLFNLVRQRSVESLLAAHVPAGQLKGAATAIGAQITAVFLIGWACGGFLFGVIGDRLGRARTMMLTILTYAVFTGLNAYVQTPLQYAVCRFLTAMGVGGEFAAGAALIAEIWPDRSRPMALGLLQSLSAVGNMLAALITLALASAPWQWVYYVGAAPALLVVFIIRYVREPEKWREARAAAEVAGAKKQTGGILQLFSDPTLARNTVAGALLAVAGVGGFWGVAVWTPELIDQKMKPILLALPQYAGLSTAAVAAAVQPTLQAYKSQVFFIQMFGGFCGMFAYAVISQRLGRRPTLLIFLVLAFAAIQGMFRGVGDMLTAYIWAFPLGVCTLAPFSAFAVYFPELYPTRLRATGVGFCYNCARFLAAAQVLWLGGLAKQYGLIQAVTIVSCVYLVGLLGLALGPETKGKPLPE